MLAQGREQFPVHGVIGSQRFLFHGVLGEVIKLERLKGRVLQELEIAMANRIVG